MEVYHRSASVGSAMDPTFPYGSLTFEIRLKLCVTVAVSDKKGLYRDYVGLYIYIYIYIIWRFIKG